MDAIGDVMAGNEYTGGNDHASAAMGVAFGHGFIDGGGADNAGLRAEIGDEVVVCQCAGSKEAEA